MNDSFKPLSYEPLWQQAWNQAKLFTRFEPEKGKPKRYLLFAFAYPSGSGLHVGHVESMTALDILARYYRMKGESVFFPVGWDAFGLPAENYAIKTGIHPSQTTAEAIATFSRQIKRLGISYAWDHEIATSDPSYYKHTQKLFQRMYQEGLAYKSMGKVNWCPSCQTVLANEQAVDGICERCGSSVVQKDLEQWYLKITEYADRLLSDLSKVDWPAPTVMQQEHWIGKSEGHLVTFSIRDSRESFAVTQSVFTTRLDTIAGATYLVVAPELVEEWIQQGLLVGESVISYLAASKAKTEEQRKIGEKTKTGVDLDLVAVNPVTTEAIPVYVADYVLAGYGTGAVMGVPAHDDRDLAFALNQKLPIRRVIAARQEQLVFVFDLESMKPTSLEAEQLTHLAGHEGCYQTTLPSSLSQVAGMIGPKLGPSTVVVLVDTDIYFSFGSSSGRGQFQMLTAKSASQIASLLGVPESQHSYHQVLLWLWQWSGLRSGLCPTEKGIVTNSGKYDGLESDQAMEAIANDHQGAIQLHTNYRLRDWLISRQRYWGVPIPVVYDPEGKPHLVKEEHLPWLLPNDVDFKPTGESPLRSSVEFIERTEKLYGPGWRPEFDTMDTFVDSSWYFLRFTDAGNQDTYASKEAMAVLMPVDLYMIGPEHIVLHLLYSRYFTKFLYDQGELGVVEPFTKMRHQGMILGPDHKKMSKSKGNVIDPDGIISEYGADTLRVYEMFMGPIEADKPWSPRSVVGVFRFLRRLHQCFVRPVAEKSDPELYRALQHCLTEVSKDLPLLKFNTAIARMMELVNAWEAYTGKDSGLCLKDLEVVAKMLAPFAPFLSEELYHYHQADRDSVHLQSWPEADQSVLIATQVEVVVQVQGKVRFRSTLDQAMASDKVLLESTVIAIPEVKKLIDGRRLVKTVVVPFGASKTALINLVLES